MDEMNTTYGNIPANGCDLKDGEPVLAPGYTCDDVGIVRKADGARIADVPIMQLDLSVRAYNCLMRAGLDHLSKLVGRPMSEIGAIRNMGKGAVADVVEKLERYLAVALPTAPVPEVHAAVEATSEPLRGVLELPLLSADVPVIAPAYAVWEGRIVRRADLAYAKDASVRELALGARASNCMAQKGIGFISGLIGMPIAELHAIRNMGAGSAKEIVEKLEKYLNGVRFTLLSAEVGGGVIALDEVLSIFEASPFAVLSEQAVLAACADKKAELVLCAVRTLLEKGAVKSDADGYALCLPSVLELIEKTFSEEDASELRQKNVLQRRLLGLSLEEIGEQEGITRERVRQIERKAWERVLPPQRVLFEEDRYAELYQNYDLEKECWLQLLGENARIYHYLNAHYVRGEKDADAALEDQGICIADRRKIEKWLYRKCFLFEKRYIPMKRVHIESVVLAKYCLQDVSFDEFCVYYNDFLKVVGLESHAELWLSDDMKKTRMNRLYASDKCLWRRNQHLRYYDVQAIDPTELFEQLNLGQYQNTEISTLKFMREHPDLMARYDIRDEYELHNLLKKIGAERENPTLCFEMMPMLRFGEFDRDEAVKQALFDLAPISSEALVEHLSEVYGGRVSTIKANWLQCIDPYYHQGEYSVDTKGLSEENMAALAARLDEDFYYLHEVKEIYTTLIDGADPAEINALNMKRMGFSVNGTYAYRNHSSAEAYFKHLYTHADVVDASGFHSRLSPLVSYQQVWKALRRDYDIVEFEPLRYISIGKLQKMGIGKERLRAFCDEVYAFVEKGSYFTVEYLRKQGFVSSLDGIGLGPRFYISVLREDPRFSGWQMGQNVLLFSGEVKMFVSGMQYVSLQGFITAYMHKVKGSVPIDALLATLEREYHLRIDRSKLVESCKDTTLYYDRITKTLYEDHESYWQQVMEKEK